MTPEALISDLQKPWRHGEHIDARGIVLDQPLILDGMVLRGVDLSGAHLRSGLSARDAQFCGLAWMMGVRFDGDLDLTGATFKIDFRAEDVVADRLLLNNIEVRGVLALARLRARTVSMTNTLIMANLTLEQAEVTKGVDLSGSEIMGGYWADGARLGAVVTNGCDLYGRQRKWETTAD